MTENTPGGECPTCGQEDNPVCSDGYHYESNTPESLEARLGPHYSEACHSWYEVAEDAIAALRDALRDLHDAKTALRANMRGVDENTLKAEQERDEARAERDRLREALERIASDESFVGHALSPVIMSDAWVEEAQAMQQHAKDALDGYDPEEDAKT